MVSVADARWSRGVIAGVASSALLFLGTGLRPSWPLTWIAALPVLLAAPRLSARGAFCVGSVAWWAGELNMWSYLRGLVPLVVLLPALIVPGVAFGLAVMLFRAGAMRQAPWRAMLGPPVAWVAYEYLTAMASPHGTFGNLAYSQMECLPVLQLASLAGVWGISFCVVLWSSALAVAWSGMEGPRPRHAAISGAVAIGLGIGWGAWRAAEGPRGDEVRVGAIASDLPGNVNPTSREGTVRLLRDYADRLADGAALGVRVIVMPEKLGAVADAETSAADGVLGAAAARRRAMIVAGVIRESSAGRFNEARVYSATGALAGSYDKEHMLPPFESDYVVGTRRTLLQVPSGPWGVAICKDMDFPALGRGYGNDGAGLLLVPAWDFGADGWLHSRMAVMRGVESGFSVVRAAKGGLLTVSDGRGRVLGESRSDAADFASIVATVPVAHEATLYARLGDWFALTDIAVLGWLAVSLVANRRSVGRN